MVSADSQATTPRDGAEDVGLYRCMVLIRRFEEEVQRLFLRGEIYGSTHLCVGQEAVSVGVSSVLGQLDAVAATYRGHGHALALGTSPESLFAELLGRSAGVCGGRAGSMNVVDRPVRLLGCFGIVGGSIAAATGAALAAPPDAVAVAFFGDGAVNQAYFYECLNFAKVRRLPLLAICENNQYGEFTPTDAVTPGGILGRARALEISAERVDGNDVWAVRRAAVEARTRVAEQREPFLLEAYTYRFSDHGRGDPIAYRPAGEVEQWKERDPLRTARGRLAAEHGVTEERLDAVEQEATDVVQQASDRALASPFPDPANDGAEYAPTWDSGVEEVA